MEEAQAHIPTRVGLVQRKLKEESEMADDGVKFQLKKLGKDGKSSEVLWEGEELPEGESYWWEKQKGSGYNATLLA